MSQPRSSRERYRQFVLDYKARRLDEKVEAASGQKPAPASAKRGRRREYMREYLRWLRPHRYEIALVFLLAIVRAGLEMIEPLFMRFMVDRVLLNTGLGTAQRLQWLNVTGAVFVAAIVVSALTGTFKDYRQRILNVRV